MIIIEELGELAWQEQGGSSESAGEAAAAARTGAQMAQFLAAPAASNSSSSSGSLQWQLASKMNVRSPSHSNSVRCATNPTCSKAPASVTDS
jgi:hypothetical protein